jgi:hypothetical protein
VVFSLRTFFLKPTPNYPSSFAAAAFGRARLWRPISLETPVCALRGLARILPTLHFKASLAPTTQSRHEKTDSSCKIEAWHLRGEDSVRGRIQLRRSRRRCHVSKSGSPAHFNWLRACIGHSQGGLIPDQLRSGRQRRKYRYLVAALINAAVLNHRNKGGSAVRAMRIARDRQRKEAENGGATGAPPWRSTCP